MLGLKEPSWVGFDWTRSDTIKLRFGYEELQILTVAVRGVVNPNNHYLKLDIGSGWKINRQVATTKTRQC